MNKLDLNGRAAIVTGGAAGIGLAIAERLVASGARVSLWDRDAKALATVPCSMSAVSAMATLAWMPPIRPCRRASTSSPAPLATVAAKSRIRSSAAATGDSRR